MIIPVSDQLQTVESLYSDIVACAEQAISDDNLFDALKCVSLLVRGYAAMSDQLLSRAQQCGNRVLDMMDDCDYQLSQQIMGQLTKNEISIVSYEWVQRLLSAIDRADHHTLLYMLIEADQYETCFEIIGKRHGEQRVWYGYMMADNILLSTIKQIDVPDICLFNWINIMRQSARADLSFACMAKYLLLQEEKFNEWMARFN